ncbi:hypothetical protein [Bradyrhizobium erythrophlei]|uniref:hypothetical protein n=1 Tax=Bradyrhizobium erythrophlei TaxID=1437360 RepID=UPI000B80C9ED|nr:hypothetical protein [Bradyrhizobium erythrophlei]
MGRNRLIFRRFGSLQFASIVPRHLLEALPAGIAVHCLHEGWARAICSIKNCLLLGMGHLFDALPSSKARRAILLPQRQSKREAS